MQAQTQFFAPSIEDQQYEELLTGFLTQLERTHAKCTKLVDNKYDQERNFAVSYHPQIEQNRNNIHRSRDKLDEELYYINRLPRSEDRIKALVRYGKGLTELSFNSLYTIIFIGKLKKRWLPRAIAISEQQEQAVSPQQKTVQESSLSP